MSDYASVPTSPEKRGTLTPTSLFHEEDDQFADMWDTSNTTYFRASQRLATGKGHRPVVLVVDVNGITVKDSTCKVTHDVFAFTTVKCYQAEEKRGTFAFLEVKQGRERVFEFYLQKARLLHTVVGQYIEQLLVLIENKKAEKKIAKQKEQLDAARKAKIDAIKHTKVPTLSAPPPSTTSRTRMKSTRLDKLVMDDTHSKELSDTLNASAAPGSPRHKNARRDPVLMERRDSLTNMLATTNKDDAGPMKRRDSRPDLLCLSPPSAASHTNTVAVSPLRKNLAKQQIQGKTSPRLPLAARQENLMSSLMRAHPGVDTIEEESSMDDDAFFAALG